MENISKYAPHVYLHQISENIYSLFVTIFAYEGQTIQIGGSGQPIYHNGSTIVHYEINGDEPEQNVNPNKAFHFQQQLTPADGDYANFNPDVFNIRIETLFCPSSNDSDNLDYQSIVLLYKDADKGEITIEQDIAIQSPYMFLNSPLSESGTISNTFDPSCLIFVKHSILDNVDLQNEDGILTQKLYFTEDNTVNDIQMLRFTSIPSNTMEYQDAEFIDGYFETQIIFAKNTTTKKKKGRIRNASADGNNPPFMDRYIKP